MNREKIVSYINVLLKENNHNQEVGVDESLFLSGILDSLAMTSLIVFLESEFKIDFSEIGFDVDEIDTVNLIENLVNTHSEKQ